MENNLQRLNPNILSLEASVCHRFPLHLLSSCCFLLPSFWRPCFWIFVSILLAGRGWWQTWDVAKLGAYEIHGVHFFGGQHLKDNFCGGACFVFISFRWDDPIWLGMFWVVPPPSNCGKWRFRLGSPTKNVMSSWWWLATWAGGTTQGMLGIWGWSELLFPHSCPKMTGLWHWWVWGSNYSCPLRKTTFFIGSRKNCGKASHSMYINRMYIYIYMFIYTL